MDDKYKDKYRILSARADWWDYRNPGAYFITICTAQQKPYFGCIVDGEMRATTAGHLAQTTWDDTVNHAQNITLGAFVVMPNHIHGIIKINVPDVETRPALSHVQTRHALSLQQQAGVTPDVQTRHALSLQQQQTPGQSRFRNPGKNAVSTIIGGYKSALSKQCRRLGIDFAWQARFHDRIIRDFDEYARIAEYIRNNPFNWRTDTLWTDS